ncbi:MAG: LiaI-LiaF-like domain-containing protein [Fibrobacterota bacterium]
MSTHHGGWSSFPRSFIAGAIIIAIGLFLLAKSLGFLPYDIDLHHFWPLILIAVGIFRLIFPSSSSSYFWGTVLIITGALFQAHYLHLISVPIHKMWPLIPIIIGVKIMLRPFFKSGNKYHTAFIHCSSDDLVYSQDKASSDDTVSLSLVLSGGKYLFSSQKLKGGYISVSLAGCEIDFTKADFEPDTITIDVNVLLGGIEMRVPETWSVSYAGTPVLGAFENKTRPVSAPAKKLLIRGSITLAGIEVKN